MFLTVVCGYTILLKIFYFGRMDMLLDQLCFFYLPGCVRFVISEGLVTGAKVSQFGDLQFSGD